MPRSARSTYKRPLARLPLADYPAVQAWHQRLQALAAWADPFAGLNAPELPPVPG